MTILVTGAAGIRRHARGGGAARSRRARHRDRQPQRLLRSRPEAGAHQAARAAGGLPLRQGRHRRRADDAGAGRGARRRHRGGRPPRSTGRRPLQHRAALRLRAQQSRGPHGDPRDLPSPSAGAAAPGLCQLELGLWRQHQGAVQHRGQGRPAGLALRRHQARRRDPEPSLCPSLRHPADRPALLHRLRPLGPARHGLLQLRRRDRRRPADHALQSGQDAARLHLYRRRGRRRDARSRAAARP